MGERLSLTRHLGKVVETNNSGLTLIIIRIYYLITLIVDMLSPQRRTNESFTNYPSDIRGANSLGLKDTIGNVAELSEEIF